jgi:hypothetical protein
VRQQFKCNTYMTLVGELLAWHCFQNSLAFRATNLSARLNSLPKEADALEEQTHRARMVAF